MTQYNLAQDPATAVDLIPIDQSPLQVWPNYINDTFILNRFSDNATVELISAQSGNPIYYGLDEPLIPWAVSVPGNGLANVIAVNAANLPQWLRTKSLEVRAKSTDVAVNPPTPRALSAVGAYDHIANMAKVGGGGGGGGHDRPTDGFLYPVC